MDKDQKNISPQSRLMIRIMIALIVMFIIGIIIRWEFVAKEVTDAVNNLFFR